MNSVEFIKTLRYYISNDATIRTLIGASDAEDARKYIRYVAGQQVNIEGGYKFPAIIVHFDEDSPMARGIPTNTVFTVFEIWIPTKTNGGLSVINNIKDRLRMLFKETCETTIVENIVQQAVTLGISLRLHDASWVGAVARDDKTQGSERLHAIICTTSQVLGD